MVVGVVVVAQRLRQWQPHELEVRDGLVVAHRLREREQPEYKAEDDDDDERPTMIARFGAPVAAQFAQERHDTMLVRAGVGCRTPSRTCRFVLMDRRQFTGKLATALAGAAFIPRGPL